MDLHRYLAFVVATSIMIASPGPTVILTIAHSISSGWKHGVTTVAGATLGIAVQLIVVVIGLASLLNLVADAFEWLRWAGVAYLIYLGIKQWRSESKPLDIDTSAVNKKNFFTQGLITTIVNPKSLIFIAAFLPQFIDTVRPIGIQYAFIVPTFLAITFVVTSAWALVAGKLRGLLKSEQAQKSVSRISGGLMILTGIGLALARRIN